MSCLPLHLSQQSPLLPLLLLLELGGVVDLVVEGGMALTTAAGARCEVLRKLRTDVVAATGARGDLDDTDEELVRLVAPNVADGRVTLRREGMPLGPLGCAQDVNALRAGSTGAHHEEVGDLTSPPSPRPGGR